MAAVEVLEKENQHLKTQNEKLNQLNEKLQQQNEALQKLASQLKHEIYGPKTEKYQDLNSGQLVFNEIEQEAQKPEPKPKQTITYTRQQGRGQKKPIPEDLPREESIIDIEEHEKVCPHDGSLVDPIHAKASPDLEYFGGLGF
jgi:transposase